MTGTGSAVRAERTVRVGSRDLFLTEVAPRGAATRGVPVVMLHGGGPGASGMSNYARNVDALAADGHRVLVPDLPGYGRSAKHVDQDDPFGDLALAVRGLLDELGIERASLVGNSYGAAAALRLALDRPDRVATQVLLGPGGIGTTRALPTPGLTALLGYYRGTGPTRAKLRTFLREYLVHDGSAVTEAMVEERYAASIDPEVVANPPLRRPSGAGALRTLRRMDLSRDRRLARCAVPTLVVWGTEDRVNRPSGGPFLAHRMPDCDLHLFGRTGHWVQFEQADRFNALMREWLA